MAYAHFLPWPALSMSVVGPVTKSPQAKTPRTFVAYVAGSTLTRPRLTSKSASTGRKVRSAAWDTAGITRSAWISNSEPGIGTDITFEQLQQDYDAVAITAGAMDAVALDIPGSDLEGVDYGVDFMKKANLGEPLEVGEDVVVVGGGYTAMDCSRTSLRHGAKNVTISYRRTRSELVVDQEELGETEREGVRMEFLASPIEVIGEDGHVTGDRKSVV